MSVYDFLRCHPTDARGVRFAFPYELGNPEPPPPTFVALTDDDGVWLTDDDGTVLIGEMA